MIRTEELDQLGAVLMEDMKALERVRGLLSRVNGGTRPIPAAAAEPREKRRTRAGKGRFSAAAREAILNQPKGRDWLIADIEKAIEPAIRRSVGEPRASIASLVARMSDQIEISHKGSGGQPNSYRLKG